MSDGGLFAWDCETYSESETRKAIPYACTLINLEKLRKMLDRINNLFPDLNPTDHVPEEFYDKLMNIVEIFVEIVKVGGRIIRILDGIVHEENFKTPPYRDYILILGDLRNKYKLEAPKVKYNIIPTSDGVLKEKKTFRGYSNNKTSVEDYIRLASGHDVSNEFNKRGERSFTNGIVIPKDDDKQKKVFKSYLNFVKRKPPISEGIMYLYSDKDEYSFDENYEFDDFDYIYIQEENEE
ncbi:hypothetical protein LOTGIDRAFT_163645 [Lottia gigantea]|uniref:Uncharacterized protein n=1 Tax=Lottia gigantea TaxID=225164 RepID=V3ZHL8_LOTGI|nr:hypothetical protein LOTGIDRAFT_163645 [Lottia gigantea]ESO90763.1 hypothetical protein LOTGIDRAFT_163645 [Lottia gigantea]